MSMKSQDLVKRIEELERVRFISPTTVVNDTNKNDLDKKEYNEEHESSDAIEVLVDESMRRARLAVEQSGCYSAMWKMVPPTYYSWTLQQRANYLGAPSIHCLCKTLLLENRKVVVKRNLDSSSSSSSSSSIDKHDPTNPKFILAVIQYTSTLDVKKLTNVIRALRPNVKERLDDTQFEWRVASEEDNRNITGYEYNSVTPFGLRTPLHSRTNLTRVVRSSGIAKIKVEEHGGKYQFFWLGGGHVHLKLGLAVSDFDKALHPIVADICQISIQK